MRRCRTLAAADIAGLRAVIVDAKDEPARRFYQRYGFESFPGDPLSVSRFSSRTRGYLSPSLDARQRSRVELSGANLFDSAIFEHEADTAIRVPLLHNYSRTITAKRRQSRSCRSPNESAA